MFFTQKYTLNLEDFLQIRI